MKQVFDAFWRAALYCLMPRVILWSLLPLLLCVGGAALLGYEYWAWAVDLVNQHLQTWGLTKTLLHWLEVVGAAGLKSTVAPLLVVALAVPVLAVAALWAVASLTTTAMANLVAARRFPTLQARGHEIVGVQTLRSLVWTVLALIALLVTIPLWLIPPLAVVLPPLIWGWLTERVFSSEVLANHACHEERLAILRAHRGHLLLMGIITGYLGAAPAMLWAIGALALVFAPLLLIASMWLYTLIFAFSSLWFAHYTLAALHDLRQDQVRPVPAAPDVRQLGTAKLEALGSESLS